MAPVGVCDELSEATLPATAALVWDGCSGATDADVVGDDVVDIAVVVDVVVVVDVPKRDFRQHLV
jgi:hypothetical protein